MIPVTPSQRAVLAAVNAYVWGTGYSPTLREIADAAGLASTSTSAYNLRQLAAVGLVRYSPHHPRTARLGDTVAGSRNGLLAQVVTTFRRCQSCGMDVPADHTCPTAGEAA